MNEEIKQAIKEHLRIQVRKKLDGYSAVLYWDDELLCEYITPIVSEVREDVVDDRALWNLYTMMGDG